MTALPSAQLDLACDFERLQAVDGAARARELAAIAVHHPDYAAELASLLDIETSDAARVDAVLASAHADAAQALATSPTGRRVGPWRVLEEIGAGGMGSVHLGERADGAYEATVAIKFLRGFPDRESLARFARERQLLARLHHPHIATLLDGGSSEDGQPCLVMTLIDGAPIDQYCRTRALTTAQRLALVEQVCEGVDYAHQQLVVHRDLKPGNVLVDAAGHAYVTDFGIAKLLDAAHDETRGAYTPGYASPEQRAGKTVGIPSDIYSLGRLLDALLGIAKRDHDLTAIVRCATHEEPTRRYRTALELQQDLRRYRERKPVAARGDSLGYRLGKLVQRHPFTVSAALVAVMALATFGVQLKSERDRAQAAETQAHERAVLAEQTTRFLVDLFRNADPAQAQGAQLSAKAILDRGYADLQTAPLDDERARALLFGTLGEIYQTIGEPHAALDGIERALALLPSGLERAALLERRSLLRLGFNQHEDALADADAALALYLEAGLPDSEGAVRAQIARSKPLQSLLRFDDARTALETALAASKGLPNPSLRAEALTFLGVLETRTLNFPQAELRLNQALALKRSALGPDHPATLDVLQALANLLSRQGKFVQWDRTTQALLEGRRRVHGENASPYGQAQMIRAAYLLHAGRLRESEVMSRQAIALFARLHANPTLEDSLARLHLALALEDAGDFAAAAEALDASIAIREKSRGPRDSFALNARHQRAQLRLVRGEFDAAAEQAEAVLELRREVLGATHADTLDSEVLTRIIRAAQTRDPRVLDDIYAKLMPTLVTARGATAPAIVRVRLLLAEYDPDPARALAQLIQHRADAAGYGFVEGMLALIEIECLRKNDAAGAEPARAQKHLRQLAPAVIVEQSPQSPRLFRIRAALAGSN